MSRKRKALWPVMFCAAAFLGLASALPAQQQGEQVELALPDDVFVIVGQSLVIITGRPSHISTVNCAAGTPQPFGGVVVDEGGGNAAQQAFGLVFRDTPARPGTKIRIIGGPRLCSGHLLLYDGIVE
jgi:hypothetical protein